MKSALAVLLFSSLLIGVFVDGEESHVSVMEGDSVTLKSGLIELKSEDGIEWRFNLNRFAKIKNGSIDLPPSRDRMQLDKQTGDLKISNIRITDSGEYKLQISKKKASPPDFIFTVSVSAAEVKSVSVMEGDSVTLPTGHTDLQKDDVIRWRFRQEESLLAEIISTSEERFRNTHLDQTGSLIFKNITAEQSGLYEAEIISTRSRYTVHRSFNVTVRDDVESVSVLEGDTVTLLTGLKKTERIKQILWKFGDETIADLNGSVTKNLNDLNHQTGDLTIRNIQKDKCGVYEVEINTRTIILHWKYKLIKIDEVVTVKSVSVTEGEPLTLKIGTEIQSNDMIHWMFGDTVIAEFNKAEKRFFTSDVPDERFKNRLSLHRETGFLTIKDIRTTDSGDYKLNISSSRYIINRILSVTVGSRRSGTWIVVVVVGVLLPVAAGVGVLIYRLLGKKSKAESKNIMHPNPSEIKLMESAAENNVMNGQNQDNQDTR